MIVKTFRGSLLFTVVALALALIYAGPTGLAVAAILAVLEISLSFDNAVVNETILRHFDPFWQKIFLTRNRRQVPARFPVAAGPVPDLVQ